MKSIELFQEQNDSVKERLQLALERIELMKTEETVNPPYRDYFQSCAEFVFQIKDVIHAVESGQLYQFSLEQLQKLNESLYQDILGDAYERSYANPAYATKVLSDKYGQLLSFLYTEMRSMIIYAFENRLFEITILLELFIEIYNYFEEEDEYTQKDIKKSIYYYVSDYMDIFAEHHARDGFDPKLTFAKEIICENPSDDLRYLYFFGEYISENERKTAEFLNAMSEEEIENMARTFTTGFQRGFIEQGMDLSKKKNVNIRYRLGFERMIKKIIEQFGTMGLDVIIYRNATESVLKRAGLKVGYHASSPNRQYEYDHRYDNAIYFDKALVQRMLTCMRQSYEEIKDLIAVYAGPSLLEVFGEEKFYPVNKEEAYRLDEKQKKLMVEYSRDKSLLLNEYLKQDEVSFTIIAYPIPEIGTHFPEIFAETIRVNNLDNEEYGRIQQRIIDTLDTGNRVHVLGSNGNKTDIWVQLCEISNPSKETIFENCRADVNIPVGEVFTSPRLHGTNGTLHISKVFLNDLEYIDLELQFEDGFIKEYTCKNFKTEEENKKYIEDNILFGHETLPIGEFAIGTNTTAYMMARKFEISDKMPILIAEKTGPHFAVGDTCYHMAEDLKVYNPDGKEIIARDNEVSILRKTNIDQAYFSCHTDITIPYDELKEISIHREDGTKENIILDGRFVLAGTEELNRVFE